MCVATSVGATCCVSFSGCSARVSLLALDFVGGIFHPLNSNPPLAMALECEDALGEEAVLTLRREALVTWQLVFLTKLLPLENK